MVKFIAEVSSNHAQDLGRSLAFVDAAADCGFDAVKFQLFRVAELFAPEILAKSEQHRKRIAWELPLAHLKPLAARCQERGVEFSCTPFYLNAVAELEPYVAFYKVASYELLWTDLLKACAATKKPVIISTGMAIMPEIQAAVSTLEKAGASDVTVLHCVSAYPSPPEQSNLAAIEAIRKAIDKTGRPMVLTMGGMTSMAIAIVAVAAAGEARWVIALTGFIAGLPAGAIMAMPTRVLQPQNRAVGMGLFFTWYYLAMALMPSLAGMLRDLSGDPRMPLFFAAALVVATVGILWLFAAATPASASPAVAR